MNKITRVEFDALTVISGRKQCPSNTDYSEINEFGESCSFGESCRFGGRCSFGESCAYNEHKLRTGYPLLQLNGAGSVNRGTTAWNTEDGIVIRCGCFEGTASEFRTQVRTTYGEKSKHARVYLGFANLCAVQFDRLDEVDHD